MSDLRKLAEAVRPGEWYPEYSPSLTSIDDPADRAFIAACSPDAIIALLDRAERAEKKLDAALQEVEDQRLEKEIAEKQRDEARAALELRPSITPEDAAVWFQISDAVKRVDAALFGHAAKAKVTDD